MINKIKYHQKKELSNMNKIKIGNPLAKFFSRLLMRSFKEIKSINFSWGKIVRKENLTTGNILNLDYDQIKKVDNK